MTRILTIFLLTLATFTGCRKPDAFPVFEKKQFIRGGETLPYRIMYPANYSPQNKYPVLLFLHGSSERGDDNQAQLDNGGSLFSSDSVRKLFPVIVIFPQCQSDSAWNRVSSTPDKRSITGKKLDLSFRPSPTVPALLAKQLLDSLVSSNVADASKIYVGGLSLGAFGALDMIERYPDFFAAAISICGGGDTTMVSAFADRTAVWMFHGDADKTVDVSNSREYVSALQKRRADVKYTEYTGVAHDSWYKVFEEKELLPWLLTKSKK